MTTTKPALPEPVPPNAEGSTTCIVRWMVTTQDGLWLGAWDKEAFAAYTQAAIDAAVAEARAVPALTFDAFRAANVARCVKWHPEGIASWSPSDWLTAVTGELGELASLLKMRNRERDGLPGNKFSPTQKQIADELADVLTYLDLLAEVLGVDLGRAAVEKFNEVSERVGFSDRIAIIATPSPAEQPKPAVRAEKLYDAIKEVLLHHRLSYTEGEDAEAFPLVDMLCPPGSRDISKGRDEITLICDAIYNDEAVRAAISGEQP